MSPIYLKSRYYPVDPERRIIYNDPSLRERDCSLPSRTYRGQGTIGIKGERLNRHPCYRNYTVLPPLKRD